MCSSDLVLALVVLALPKRRRPDEEDADLLLSADLADVQDSGSWVGALSARLPEEGVGSETVGSMAIPVSSLSAPTSMTAESGPAASQSEPSASGPPTASRVRSDNSFDEPLPNPEFMESDVDELELFDVPEGMRSVGYSESADGTFADHASAGDGDVDEWHSDIESTSELTPVLFDRDSVAISPPSQQVNEPAHDEAREQLQDLGDAASSGEPDSEPDTENGGES